jgi:hypothetical protein
MLEKNGRGKWGELDRFHKYDDGKTCPAIMATRMGISGRSSTPAGSIFAKPCHCISNKNCVSSSCCRLGAHLEVFVVSVTRSKRVISAKVQPDCRILLLKLSMFVKNLVSRNDLVSENSPLELGEIFL